MYTNRSIDQTYFIISLILIGIGFVIQYSASSSLAASKFNDPGYFMRGHLVRIVIGLIAAYLFVIINYNYLKNIAFWLAISAVVLLIVTLIFNAGKGYVARWIPVGPFRLQSSEFAKFALIVYITSFLDRHRDHLEDFRRGFLPPAVILMFSVGLIAVAPDFSSAAVIALIGIVLMVLGGTRIPHLLPLLGTIILAAVAAVLYSPYRLKRIVTFLNADQDLAGAGYQINQSLITLGNGGFWGRGLAGSIEKNLFLPDPHTDFVFAVTGEEFGFIGTLILLILFLGLFLQGIRISLRAPDNFGMLLGIGISFSMFFYVLINVGVVCGIFPVTGLPLPFLSYGGSTMIFNLIGTGIILNISRYRNSGRKPVTLLSING